MKWYTLLLVILACWTGHALAESAAQDAIPIYYYPTQENINSQFQTTNCLKICKVMYSKCAVDCTELISVAQDLQNQLNGSVNGELWF